MRRKAAVLATLAACGGGLEIAGTYLVTPTLSTDGCGGACPAPAPLTYKVAHAEQGYSIQTSTGVAARATYAADTQHLTWFLTSNLQGGCVERDWGDVKVGQGRFDGNLEIQFTCGSNVCNCFYNLLATE